MFKWFKASTLDPLSVSMAGVKLADRVLVVGCSDPKLIAALAVKAGLTGRTVAIDDASERTKTAERIALQEGALIEAMTAPLATLPLAADTFDVVVLRDVLRAREPNMRLPVIAEARRVLRPGGRCIVIETIGRSGVAAMFGGKDQSGSVASAETIAELQQVGYVAVRTLAEREGLVFVEAIKRNA
ncbi:MAG TPA: methyltransferase domain-containing protein [Vicinamibacterales bacterium]|nr:methyltransferase domain-containing protein [Vicinamibacterales bacterium]